MADVGIVKKFYRLSDEAQVASLEKQIESHFCKDDLSEQTLRRAAELADKNRFAELSGNILVQATVFHLLTAFVEFAMKEVFKLVWPNESIPEAWLDLIERLKKVGVFTQDPPEYVDNVSKYREPVRNQLAHGDWRELAKTIRTLNIEKVFLGTAKLMEHLQTNLGGVRPDLSV
jgi:hypothetical protein